MNSWANIKTIAKRELGAYFTSPLAYVFLVIFLFLAGVVTFAWPPTIFERGQATLSGTFFSWHPLLYVFLIPAIGMRLWAEERRVGTLELLLTMPITPWQAISGKFLASWIFLGIALILTFPAVITVNYLGTPDNGVILCGYIGSWLMAGAYLAISCMTSAMTRTQVVSFVLSFVICLLLVLAGFEPVMNVVKLWFPNLVEVVGAFSLFAHFQDFQRGIIDSRDVLFYLSVIGFSLFSTSVILRSHRS